MTDRTPVLVLGLGNIVCEDDGAGVVAVHRLRKRYELPEGVVALDGGTLGLALLPRVDSADALILVDAIRAEGPPGTLVRIEGSDVAPAVVERLSPHQIGVADLLTGASLLDRYPARVVLLGVVPERLGLGVDRTPAVEASIPALVEAVAGELDALGYPPTRRTDADASTDRSLDRVSRALGV